MKSVSRTEQESAVGRQLEQAPIPLPPLPEQRWIVAHVGALRALQSETAAELDALLPSVLNLAFAGEL